MQLEKKVPELTQYFNQIEEQHKKYLEKNMVINHMELIVGNAGEATIVAIVDKIKNHRFGQNTYLDEAIKETSLSSKIGHGALAALLGAGAGGLAYYASEKFSVLETLINKVGIGIPAASTISGGFVTLLAAGVSTTLYKCWAAKTEGNAVEDISKFHEELEKFGFDRDFYQNLGNNLVKLFHFRECLLLGLEYADGSEFRKKIKTEHNTVNDEKINAAIEVYFLEQLNGVFTEAFTTIYTAHNKEINEAQQGSIFSYLREFFQSKPSENFTQDMQIKFMQTCMDYLTQEMNELSFFGRYPKLSASASGLIAGTIALGLATTLLGGPITISVAAIVLVAASLSVVTTYLAIKSFDYLHYKRSNANRQGIHHAIQSVSKEKNRLQKMVKQVAESSAEDMKQLGLYNKINNSYFIFNGKNCAGGATMAWVKEYASRYRMEQKILVELKPKLIEVAEAAEKQTATLVDGSKTLEEFISDTRAYLNDQTHKEFIEHFDVINKIKQQVLDIVAKKPAIVSDRLKEFYKGDLQGDLSDLSQISVLKTGDDCKNEASKFNAKLVSEIEQNKKLILRGDDKYRGHLLLLTEVPVEINGKNIEHYLKDSFEFLYSLNESPADSLVDYEEAFTNTSQFIIYRTLLLKQLADFADPNNLHIDEYIKEKINHFMAKKIGLDHPEILFRNIRNQGLLEDSLNEENTLLEAIKVNMANCKPTTPRMLIAFAAEKFLEKANKTNRLFGYANKNCVNIEPSQIGVNRIREAIAITQDFLRNLTQLEALMKSGAVVSYAHALEKQIEGLISQVESLRQPVNPAPQTTGTDSSPLEQINQALQSLKEDLNTKYPHQHKERLQETGKINELIAKLEERLNGIPNGMFAFFNKNNSERNELVTLIDQLKQNPENSQALLNGINNLSLKEFVAPYQKSQAEPVNGLQN